MRQFIARSARSGKKLRSKRNGTTRKFKKRRRGTLRHPV